MDTNPVEDETKKETTLVPSIQEQLANFRKKHQQRFANLNAVTESMEKESNTKEKMEETSQTMSPTPITPSTSPLPQVNVNPSPTSFMKEEEEKEDVCRVCRCEAEENRPLYFPCRCTGSIKYVHEDCLVKWLETSKSKMCELCKTSYTFSPVYAADKPSRLPIKMLFLGALKKLSSAARFISRLFLVLCIWGLIIPLSTSFLWKFFLGNHRSFIFHISSFDTKALSSDWLLGFFLSCAIVIVLITLSTLVEWTQARLLEMEQQNAIERERLRILQQDPMEQINQQLQQVNENGELDLHIQFNQIQNQQGIVPNINQNIQNPLQNLQQIDQDENEDEEQEENDEEDDEDDNENNQIALDEFVGLTGPLVRLIEKSILVLASFGAFLCAVMYIPKVMGQFVIMISEYLVEKQIQTEMHEESTFKSEEFVAIFTGYAFLISLALAWLGYTFYDKQRNRSVISAVKFVTTFLKIGVVLSAEAIIFPIGAGYFLDYNILTPTHLEFDVFSIIVHWLCGLCYMFCFANIVSWLHDILRKGALWFFRNPNDPDFDILREIMNTSALRYVRRFTLSVFTYFMVVFFVIVGPVMTVRAIFPTLFPIDLFSGAFYELFLDYLVFRMLLPHTFNHINPIRALKNCLSISIKTAAYYLDLESYLLPHANNNNQNNQNGNAQNADVIVYPSYFKLRLFCFIFGAFSVVFIIDVWLISIPILTGRILLQYLIQFKISDLYALVLALYFYWGLFTLVRLIVLHYNQNSMNALGQRLFQISIATMKWAILSALWLGYIPILLGYFWESTLFVPFKTPIDQCSENLLLLDWFFGLIAVNSVSQSIIQIDLFRETGWRNKFDKILNDGFVGVDFVEILKTVIAPILIPLTVAVTTPHLVVTFFDFFATDDPILVEYVFRGSFVMILAGFIIGVLLAILQSFLPKLQQTILDEYYLIGRKLHNYTATSEISKTSVINTENVVNQ